MGYPREAFRAGTRQALKKGCIIYLLNLENIENGVEANQPNLIDIPLENTSIII